MKEELSPEEQQIYLEQLMENYRNPHNFGKIDNPTFSHHIKNTSCGDIFDIYVKLSPKQNKIQDVKFFGEGCAISTASMSFLTEKLIGMSFKKSEELSDSDIYDMIGIKISPSRVNCAMLSIKAYKEAVEEFKTSQATTKQENNQQLEQESKQQVKQQAEQQDDKEKQDKTTTN